MHLIGPTRYAFQVREAGRALMALGLDEGDRTCILGFNRPEWTTFDLATMTAGGVPAGIYTTSSPEEAAYIIGHTEAGLVLVEDRAQLDKLLAVRDQLLALRHVVLMAGAAALEHHDGLVLTRHGLEPDDLATLIYTSGTTGPPKGVMLTHDNLAWTADAAVRSVDVTADDTTLSYLPPPEILDGSADDPVCEEEARSLGVLLEYRIWLAEPVPQ